MSGRLRAGGPAIAGLLAVVLVLFSDVVFGGRVFYDRDIHLEWYSQMDGFVRSVAAGAWPLWDTTIAFGQPLLADPSAQIAYPLTWLNLVLLPWDYYTVFVVLHSVATGVGMFLLARHLGTPRLAAFAAAGVWMASGPLLSLVNVWHHFAGACWIPWVALAAARAAQSGAGLPRALIWGLAEALQILAGSSEMAAMGVVASVVVILAGLSHDSLHARPLRELLVRSGLAAIVAVGLSSLLWMPTLDLLMGSSRSSLSESMRTTWSVPPLALARTLLPLPFLDLPLQRVWQERLFDRVPPFLDSLYLGLPTLALALRVRRSPHRTLRRVGIVLFLGAIALALGRHAPFYGAAVLVFPPLAIFRYPSKVMLLAAFAWALLVGGGVDATDGPAEGRRRSGLAALALIGALVAAAGAWVWWQPTTLVPFLLPPPWPDPWVELSWSWASGFVRSGLALLVVVILLVAGRGPRRSFSAAAMVTVCVVDLIVAHRPLNLTTARELVAFRPPILDGLDHADHRRLYVFEYFLNQGSSPRYLGREDPYVIPALAGQAPTPQRKVLAQRLYPFPPVAGRWGFEGSFDVDTRGLYPREVSSLVALLHAAEGTPRHQRLLRLGAVRRVIALHSVGFEELELEETLRSLFPEPIRRFAVRDPLPRSYAVGGVRVASGQAALNLLGDPSFDPTREVVLASLPIDPPSPGFSGSTRIVELVSDRVRIEALLNAPGYVVLVDAYDPGWQATLDGEAVQVLRANTAFRAVRAPAGRHVIEYTYRPVWLMRGVLVSLATALGSLAIALVATRRASRSGP